MNAQPKDTFLVIGGTGKTGRRVAARLSTQGLPVRIGSRSADPAFDWDRSESWPAVLSGVRAVYITYFPDLMLPEAAARIGAFARCALALGTRRLVLLSGRGEAGAEASEEALKAAGADWTILRASWFAQNFSENFLVDAVLAGEVALPASTIAEPFIDADDIAEIAVAALMDDKHIGHLYELTGPRLLTFPQAVETIAKASGRTIRFTPISTTAYGAMLAEHGVPEDFRTLVMELFTEVLDGRNAHTTQGVERVLGRPARDFADYAKEVAATGVWNP